MPENKSIPKDWKWVKVSSIAQLFRGINYTKDVASDKPFDGGLPILRGNNINGDLNFDNLVYVPSELIKKEQYIKRGDVIFAMSSGSKHLVGKSAVATNDFKGSYGAFCALLRIGEIVNKKYISYIFKGNSYRKLISEIAKGTNINNLKREHILDFELPLPPKPTQQAIVSKIEELFSELDKGIENLQLAQQQLKTYRQSVLKWAFEGKLTKEWRKAKHFITSKDLTASITKKRVLDYKRKLEEWEKSNSVEEKISKPQRPSNLDPKNDLFEGLVKKETIPVEWEIVPLVFVSDNQPNSIVDGPFGSSINVNEDYIDSGVPVIRMVNIRPFRFVQDQMKFIKESKFQSLRRHNILPHDILIAKVGATIGDCCIYPINQPEAMLSTTGSCRIRLDKNVMNTKFLEYHIFFHRNTLKDIASQTAQPFLNMKVLKSFPVVLPTIEEQSKIVQEIESRLSVADKMEESITQSLQQAEALRQSILKKAFEGKLLC